MEDWEMVDMLLSNSPLVLPQLAMNYTLWLGEHHLNDLSLPVSVQWLGTAEQSHLLLRQQGSTSAGDGELGYPARQVHGVAAQN
ncbi:hypothetical protein GN958_ATG15948 [Phytophthora infestans]|uniref:Uncharacterized protein n=1 Tax=Phytophthora infestans TaxID=4787 RepID=A0A8S9U4V9_PHYIN|nr:hypothetical protein GN958_ATG15948 [Phytophthora infestans]